MGLPEISRTEALEEALACLAQARLDAFVAGLDLDVIENLVEAVRAVDAETVHARHVRRGEEFSPYYPDSYWSEVEGYEAAAELLRGPIPEQLEGE